MKISAEALLVRMEFLCLVGIVVGQVLGKPGIASAFFTITFLLTAALWAVVTARRISQQSLLVLGILLLSGISVCGNALLTGTVADAGYLRKLVIFWAAVMQFGAVAECVPDEKTAAFLLRWNRYLALFLMGAWLLRQEEMYQIHGRVTIYLTFRFTNPNLAAAFLSAICMLEWAHGEGKTGRKRWISILICAALVFFVWETRARNAQLVMTAFFVTVAAERLLPVRRRLFRRWLPMGIALAPLIFACAYLLLMESWTVQQFFSFLAGEGKGLDSRVEIWRFALGAFWDSPLLGAYSQISGGTGASQMHNSHVDILASYGGPVLILTCLFLTMVLQKQCRGRFGFLCMAGFSAMLLSGLGEAMLFSGGMGIGLYAGMLRLLGNFEEGKHRR